MQGRKSGQERIELSGIGGREHAREPTVGRVVDRQRRLEAGNPRVGRRERIKSAPELIRLRDVFGIVDDSERTSGKWKRDVERLRLGPRSDRWRCYDCERRTQVELGKGSPGVTVVGLNDEYHIKFFRRVVDGADRRAQIIDDARLAIECANDDVDGKLVIAVTNRWT
jgi:hypothetical protein